MTNDYGCTCYSSGADDDCPKHKFAASSVLLPVGRQLEPDKWIEAIQQALGDMGRIGDRDYFTYCMWLVFDQAAKDGLIPADPRTSKVLAKLKPKISAMKSKLVGLPVGESTREKFHADTLAGIYCNGQAVDLIQTGERKFSAINWEGWQRVADYVNKKVGLGESREPLPGQDNQMQSDLED